MFSSLVAMVEVATAVAAGSHSAEFQIDDKPYGFL